MAANEQGKFWEMHAKLFANQQNLDAASLEKYAKEIGLDMAKFKAATDSHKFAAQIEGGHQAGQLSWRAGHACQLSSMATSSTAPSLSMPSRRSPMKNWPRARPPKARRR